MVITIISNRETGVSRAALDWAIANDGAHGGWCAKQRKVDGGPIPSHYALQEVPREYYPRRDEWNVRDSSITAIFTISATLSVGLKRTARLAEKQRKPSIHLSQADGEETCAKRLRVILEGICGWKLHVVGSTAAKEPEVYEFVQAVLTKACPAKKAC